jgi:cellobiose phosphorylase
MIPGPRVPKPPVITALKSEPTFALTELRSASGLCIAITPEGAVHSIRHGATLINQVIPGPSEDGFSRLILRWRGSDGTSGWAPLAGPTVSHRSLSPTSMEWASVAAPGITCRASLLVHPDLAAWTWRTTVTNTGTTVIRVDVLMAQDLGLADEGAVRNNEAFNSQYLDLLPVEDEHLGWVLLSRQNQAAGGGAHPWLAMGCERGACAYSTDASQFFGEDHRLTGTPAAVRTRNLPSQRLQYECAMPALQSRSASLYPGSSTEVAFVARFIADHPSASSKADLARLWEATPSNWPSGTNPGFGWAPPPPKAALPSLFVASPWLHGDNLVIADWERWFPGPRRNEELSANGSLLSFFQGKDSHVISLEKEANLPRPHGHILRSGSWSWVDNEQFGITCYAAGIFSAQAYLGNPTFGRLLPVVRSALGLGRAAGQRVFVRRGGEWRQLGIPSAFAMAPGEARWIYRLGLEVIEAKVWCSRDRAAAFLEIRLSPESFSAELLVTHTLALGPNEFEQSGRVTLDQENGVVVCDPDPRSMMAMLQPGACFAIATAEPSAEVELGGDEMLYAGGGSRGHPCVAIRTASVRRLGVVLCGSGSGRESLLEVVNDCRQEWKAGCCPSVPGAVPIRLSGSGAVSKLDEILPWLNHNAAIHFSAPHGLEQQGGAAWGVRDVCQGSVEWLLTGGDWTLVRRILESVFSQQYSRDGSWPQWFMHPPYQTVQQAHSHGDVCFWPLKALCDYLEASNDLAFLDHKVGYTDPTTFLACGPEESLLRHCDRVVDQCEARFVRGTSLVDFGDGDWDDTLQPADPAIRTRMISSWTVALVYHAFRQLAHAYREASQAARAERLEALLTRIRGDFSTILMPDSTVAGFVVKELDGSARPLLHPRDRVTGIRYRLLPMTRSILAELFTPEQAIHHLGIIERELVYPDGARLMSEPAQYKGGLEQLFRRADSASNVGREIGLQYVHAHLRYAEAMAKVGRADELWRALEVVNPVGLSGVLANAAPRQSNMYFSSSDAVFGDRIEAARRWSELKTGSIAVRGGWRLYSSGPGIFLHAVRASLLGLREFYGEIVFDPVIPKGLDGLQASMRLCGRTVIVRFRVEGARFGPTEVAINGTRLEGGRRESNPYRTGGLCFDRKSVAAALSVGENEIVVVV